MRRPRIGILVVAYNAEATLRGVLARIPPAIRAKIDEVFVFDDASQDRTFAVAKACQEEFEGMKLTLFRNFKVLSDKTKTGQPLDLEERIRFRYQSAMVVDRCAKLISQMFYCCGAQGIYRDSPLVRTFLDIHTGRTHIANNPDKVGRNYGGFLLGKENTDTFI